MSFSVSFPTSFKQMDFFNEREAERVQKKWELFEETVFSEDTGFFNANLNKELRESSKRVFEKFKHKKYFVHIGIGGSSLGASTLVEALGQRERKSKVFFLDNIDPEEVSDLLKSIRLKETLFYFVSKSGGTAETLAIFSLVLNQLSQDGILEEEGWTTTLSGPMTFANGIQRVRKHRFPSFHRRKLFAANIFDETTVFYLSGIAFEELRPNGPQNHFPRQILLHIDLS